MDVLSKKQSALIVDDNRISRRITSTILKSLDVSVYEAENGYEAIDFLEEFSCTAVFMNLYLPDLNGFETTVRIRELERNNDVPIIAISADSFNKMSQEIIDAGFTTILGKPLQKDEVSKLLKSLEKDTLPVFDYEHYSTTYKDVSLQKDIVQTFLDEEESDTKRIQEAFLSGDGDEIYAAVHYMKGSFSYLKAAKILIVTQTILDHIKKGNLDLALKHELAFKSQYKELVEVLKKHKF